MMSNPSVFCTSSHGQSFKGRAAGEEVSYLLEVPMINIGPTPHTFRTVLSYFHAGFHQDRTLKEMKSCSLHNLQLRTSLKCT